jgi:Lamin Tail Domain
LQNQSDLVNLRPLFKELRIKQLTSRAADCGCDSNFIWRFNMDFFKKKASCACVLTALISSTFTLNIQAASVRDLLITEVMANPLQVSDGNGEWFELFNPTTSSINLEGLILSDDGSNNHTISTGGPLLITAGQYFVMGKNGDSTSNGGFTADYLYSNFSLGNSGDQIVFSNGLSELLRLNYSASFDIAGQSMELTGLPMTESSYALTHTSLIYGLGDIGTPGMAGSFMPSPVPLPAAAWLFGSGLIGLTGIGRRRKIRS